MSNQKDNFDYLIDDIENLKPEEKTKKIKYDFNKLYHQKMMSESIRYDRLRERKRIEKIIRHSTKTIHYLFDCLNHVYNRDVIICESCGGCIILFYEKEKTIYNNDWTDPSMIMQEREEFCCPRCSKFYYSASKIKGMLFTTREEFNEIENGRRREIRNFTGRFDF